MTDNQEVDRTETINSSVKGELPNYENEVK